MFSGKLSRLDFLQYKFFLSIQNKPGAPGLKKAFVVKFSKKVLYRSIFVPQGQNYRKDIEYIFIDLLVRNRSIIIVNYS